MRPRSMTGFGRGEASASGRTWIAEVRTVNHRFLDQKVVLPRFFGVLEKAIKTLVATSMDRGRVEITLTLQGECESGSRLKLNEAAARQYYNCLQELVQQYELAPTITLNDMLHLRDIISAEEQVPDADAEWPLVSQALAVALSDCDRMREREGGVLRDELLDRLEKFSSIIATIEAQVPEILLQRQLDLKVKIEKLLGGLDIDPLRLAQETAILADKSDVTEEISRLGSHIAQFRAFLFSDEPVGRRLDFLLQEFLREVNTLASKISNAGVAQLSVEMKNEIEKLREQVQNIE